MNRIFTVNRTQDLHYAEAVIMIMTEDKPGAPTSQGIMGNNPKKGDSGPMAPRHPSLLEPRALLTWKDWRVRYWEGVGRVSQQKEQHVQRLRGNG